MGGGDLYMDAHLIGKGDKNGAAKEIEKERKHAHYFKDVEQLSEVDVYRVCDLFAVNDPSGATQHAIKKLLLPGKRGAGKSHLTDIQEAIDTLTRRLQMYYEDEL